MKTRFSAVLAVILCITLSLGFLAGAQVPDILSSKDVQAGIYVAPGHTESERNIHWYSDSSEKTYAVISENEDLSEPVVINPETEETPQGDYTNVAYVSGLKAGETYYYAIFDNGEYSETYSFTTVDGNSFSALYVTDVHVSYDDENEDTIAANSAKFASVVNQAGDKRDISLILSAGDQASLGRRDEYCAYAADAAVKNTCVAITCGNHDRKNIDYKFFNANPETDVSGIRSYVAGDYWFVKGDTLFLIIDSNNADARYHRRFMQDAVKRNSNVKWKVAMFHHDLFGGRIESRESENELLRIIWTPLIDEFGVDLVLLGHSHYYTISNVIYNKKTVGVTRGVSQVTDPEGTIYMVSGSINRPRSLKDGEIPPVGENVGQYVDTEKVIYNVIDFSEDSIKINSYYLDEEEPFNTFTIAKTSRNGGHPKQAFNPLNPIIRFIAEVYALFNNIGVISDLKEKYDISIPILQGLFGF